eukprot:9485315-Pyramimonas_sp.AAC.1
MPEEDLLECVRFSCVRCTNINDCCGKALEAGTVADVHNTAVRSTSLIVNATGVGCRPEKH